MQWPTSEHYFRAQKFADAQYQEAIRHEESPMRAAKMARDRSRQLRSDWKAFKDDVVRRAVAAKFSQHSQLQGLLLSTGDALIVERTANDHYWGDGGDSTGLNRLGQILMKVRQQLRHSV